MLQIAEFIAHDPRALLPPDQPVDHRMIVFRRLILGIRNNNRSPRFCHIRLSVTERRYRLHSKAAQSLLIQSFILDPLQISLGQINFKRRP